MNTPMPRFERDTQNRIVRLFTTPSAEGGLGYEYLGNWRQRHNRAIEPDLLRASLTERGYLPAQISAALQKLETAADVANTTLYQANLRTYQLLRYGVPVRVAIGQAYETVHLIDWENLRSNRFALAEEVTRMSGHERRPDIVLYINGMAVAVMELKRSSVEVGDGIRQLISNQEQMFNPGFFSAVQLLLAGNDARLALRNHWHAGTVLRAMEGRGIGNCRTGHDRCAAGPPAGANVPTGSAARFDPQFRDLRRRAKEGAKAAPVSGHQGGANAHRAARRRRDLAHAGQRQKHSDGVAGPVATGAGRASAGIAGH
jgi:hypothetical protein